MGRERQLFTRQLTYYAHFKDVKGLHAGAPVRLGGIGIGRVDKVAFTDNVNDPTVEVTLLINQDFTPRIRSDALAIIETQGLLGDRFINLIGGQDEKELPTFAVMRSAEPADLGAITDEVKKISEKASSAMTNLDGVLAQLQSGGVKEITEAAKGISQLVKTVNEGDGVLHQIFYEKQLATDISATATNVAATTKAILEGDGVLNKLVFDANAGNAISGSMVGIGEASIGLRDLLNEINRSKGLLKSLLVDDAPATDGQTPSQNAAAILANLAKASEALASGKGTLGALLMDAKLYDNVTEVTDEAKRSFLLRQAIRSVAAE